MNDSDIQKPPSRPSTPIPTIWFEFLLDPTLLEKHFVAENADPPIPQLLVQFVDQSIKSQGVEETQAHVRKTHSLKLLALQVAAHFNWNLNTLKKHLPLYMVHKVLKDFVETVSPPDLNIQPGNDVCLLQDYVLVALTIYNRWCIQTIVDSGFPSKANKSTLGLPPNGANLNVAGVHEMVIKTVSDTLHDSVNFLERCLPLDRNVVLPTTKSFVHPTTDACQTSDMIDFTAGFEIQREEYLCQLCFDLGGFYFHQRELGKAAAMFERVFSLLPKLSGELIYKDVEKDALDGYLAACGSIASKASDEPTMVEKVEQCASQGYQGIVELLIEDNVSHTLPTLYREALQHVLKGQEHGKIGSQVAMCNLVSRHLTKTPGNCEQLGQLRSCSAKDAVLLGEIIAKTAFKCSASNKTSLKLLLRFLCECQTMRTILLQGPAKDLFTGEELRLLQRKPLLQSQLSVSTESVASHDDNVALQLGQLEQRLIQSNSAEDLDKLLTSLRRIAPNKSCMSICQKWQIDKSYAFILDGVGNKRTKDYVFMLLVKSQHCTRIKDYEAAKLLLEKAHNLTKDFSFKLSKALQHEILYVELLRASDRLSSSHRIPITDVIPRIQACLASAKIDRDIPPHAQIIEKCIVHLLNSEEWIAVLNVDHKASYVQLCQMISRVCKELPDLNESRRPARELWEMRAQMFSANLATKRNNSGRPVSSLQRDSNQGQPSRMVFLKLADQIQDRQCLSILLSCLVRLHNVLKDDVTIELSHDYAVLWPSTVSNVNSVNIDAVTTTMIHVLRHVISVDPNQPSWLKTQADIHYANNQYAAALQYYLQSALVATKFFEIPVPKEVWNEQVYKRMIKCCTNLKCHTQVAILCQFLEPVDYTTAFKSLQEKTCYDAMDALYCCIWDVAILEFIVFNHQKLNEVEKKQKAIQALNTPELNTSNPDEILNVATQKRNQQFYRALCKQYL